MKQLSQLSAFFGLVVVFLIASWALPLPAQECKNYLEVTVNDTTKIFYFQPGPVQLEFGSIIKSKAYKALEKMEGVKKVEDKEKDDKGVQLNTLAYPKLEAYRLEVKLEPNTSPKQLTEIVAKVQEFIKMIQTAPTPKKNKH